jgi:hypothetical protein
LYALYFSWQQRSLNCFDDEGGDRTRFQIFATNAEGYISIGFSDDQTMVSTDVS